MTINVVILNFGYVESTSLTALVCVNERHVFASQENAIKDLAQDLLAKYKYAFDTTPEFIKTCCREAVEDSNNNYCNKCGTNLRLEFNSLQFQSWLLNLRSFDLDSYGYDDECDGRDMTWVIGESPDCLLGRPKKHIVSVERAEHKILEVLGMEYD